MNIPKYCLYAILVLGIVIFSVHGAVATPATHEPASHAEPPLPAENATLSNTTAENNSEEPKLTASDIPKGSQLSTTSRGELLVGLEAVNQSSLNFSNVREAGGEIVEQAGSRAKVRATSQEYTALKNLPWVVDSYRIVRASETAVSEGVADINATWLQSLNVSGEGVSVGIVTGGVDPYSPEYADQVVDTAVYSDSGISGSDDTHGTGVTEIVSDMAPNASLYLTSTDDSFDFQTAVGWLRDQDVDIIVTSIVFLGYADDGTSPVSESATEATDNGIFFANAAGNYADGYWSGSWADGDDDGWLNFTGSDEANAIYDGQQLRAGDSITLHLKWQDFPTTDTDYDVHLVDANGDTVKRSYRYFSDSPYESLTATLPSTGAYYVAVSGEASPHTISVTAEYPIEHTTPEGSIKAPATATGVTAVGAYNVSTGSRANYSSVGPTADGRRGIDLLAPSSVETTAYDGAFSGTSAAAPHVAGAAALLQSIQPSADGGYLERALQETATDVLQPGADVYSGAGKINAAAAGEWIAPAVSLSIRPNRSDVAVGDWVQYEILRSDTVEPINATLTIGESEFTSGPDGLVNLTYFEAGDYTLLAESADDPPLIDFEPYSLDESVDRGTVGYNLAANRSTMLGNGTVQFRVTTNSTGYPASNVTIAVNGENVSTNSTGYAMYRFDTPGTYTATTTVESTSNVIVTNDTVKIHVQQPATLSVRNYTVSQTTVSKQTDVLISATVTNTGDVSGSADVTFYADGSEVSNTTVAVGGGNSTTATETATFSDVGTHNVSVNELNATDITVQESATFNVSYTVNSTTVLTGEDVMVTATVKNTGNVSGSTTVKFYADGSEISNASLTVGTGNTTTVSETMSFSKVGTSTVTVNNLAATTLTVEEPEPVAPAIVEGRPAQDLDGDGAYEDINGDGVADVIDVNALFQHRNSPAVQGNATLFDFNGDNIFDITDINKLFLRRCSC